MALFILSLRDFRRNILWTILTLLICFVSLDSVSSSITNASSMNYQEKLLEKNIRCDMNNVIHLHFSDTTEDLSFTAQLHDFLNKVQHMEGVGAIGRFDQTGDYFSELENNPDYLNINKDLLNRTESKYIETPGITQIVYADESVLKLLNYNLSTYPVPKSGASPILVSETFSDIMPIGMQITLERTGDVFEVAGYIDKKIMLPDENDLIRFPVYSSEGIFIAPFPQSSDQDVMTQLSTLQNTYVFLEHNADGEQIEKGIEKTSAYYGLSANGSTLQKEYRTYKSETSQYVKRLTALAVFIAAMVVSSITSVFTTLTLLGKRRFGIYLANGYSRKDLIVMLIIKASLIIFSCGITAWLKQVLEILFSNSLDISLFRNVLIYAHLETTLPLVLLVCLIMVNISVILPVMNILKFKPDELIREEGYGTD